MNRVAVSLILPVCGETDAARILGNQTFTDFELLIPAGEKGEICGLADPRIRILSLPKSGDVRSRGIEAARGKYLAFWGGDCLPSLHTLSALWQGAEKSGAQVTLCGYQTPDGTQVSFPAQTLEGRAVVRRFAAPQLPGGIAGGPGNKLYRTDFIRENRLRFSDVGGFRGELFDLQVFDRAERVRVLPDILCRYERVDPGEKASPADELAHLGQIAEEYADALELWGVQGEEPASHIPAFYLNRTAEWVDSLCSSGRCSRGERNALLKRLHLDPAFRRWVGGGEGLSPHAARVTRLVMEEKYRRIPIAVRFHRLLKGRRSDG